MSLPSQSKPEPIPPQGEALDERQPVVRLVDESTTSIPESPGRSLPLVNSPAARERGKSAASILVRRAPTPPGKQTDAGAGLEASPAQPAPVALTIRRYVKRIPNHLSSSNNAGFENRGWHTVSLPFLSILSDMASPDGEVVI